MLEDNVRKRLYMYDICVYLCVCVCMTGSFCCTVEIDKAL